MSILSGKGKVKLDGQKGLTKDKPILTIDTPDVIYVPLVLGVATDFDVHVKEGDHVCIGTKLATRKSMYVPIYSPVSGTVKGIEKRMHASKRLQNHIVIENDHKDERVKAYEVADPDHMSQEDVIKAIKELGIVGLGGSGFPTYMKYENVQNIETILINGVECEPFLTSDHVAMKRDIKALFDGAHYMIKAAGAKKAIIAIKEHKPDLMELLVEEAKNYDNIEPREVPDRYPMGWERVLVRTVFKKEYDRLPAEIGVIVNNSSTAIALSKGIRNGEAITHRVVTFSGNGLKNPQNVDVAIGTPVNYIVEKIGGYIDEDGVLKFALLFNYDIDYQRVERRMKYLYNEGEMAGKTFEDYIAHEIAHILPFQDCITEEDYRRVREELRTAFVGGVSGYADRTRDGAESLAEAFVKYRNGETIPDGAEKLIRKYIYPWRK